MRFGLERFSGLYLLALFIIVFGIWEPSLFLSMSTVHTVASQQAIQAIVALGVLIPLAAGAYDLSVGAVANLTAVMVVSLQTVNHWSLGAALTVTFASAIAIGFVNGFIVVKLHVNSFIATLGTSSIIAAIQIIVAGETPPEPPTTSTWTDIGQLSIGGFQITFWDFLILAFIVWWLLDYTPVGRYLYAIGGNEDAARLSGVRVGRWTWMALIASSALAGLAGVLYSSQSGPSLTFGATLLLPAFAAIFLGSTQIKPGRPNVWGTVLAIYVLAIGVEGLELGTSVQWLSEMFDGVALVGAVAFAVWRQRRGSGSTRGVVPPSAKESTDDDGASPDQVLIRE